MKKTILWAGAAIVAALCSFPAKADKVFYVDPDGGQPEGITVDAVYTTVQAAVNAATVEEPTTIYLKPGHTFSEGDVLFEQRADITIIGDNSTFRGVQNKRILRTSVARLVLKGITFTGVDYTYGSGGALYFMGVAGAKSELVVDSCVFADNTLGSSDYVNGGAAIATNTNDMDVTISNCVFRNNVCTKYGDAMKGGAIVHQGKNGTFEVLNCTFDSNRLSSATGGAIAVGIGNGENVAARIVNNTFFNNTVNNVPTGSVGNIFIHGTNNTVDVVNNTFYFDRREEDPGEGTGDQERMKAVYKRTAAVNVNDGGNTLNFVNNVVTGTRSAVISAATSGRTINCHNNYCVMVEPHVNTAAYLVDGQQGNVVLTARESNTGDPFIRDIEALNELMTGVGIASTLTTDNFVPYLAIDATSPLRNAGVAEYLVAEANIVPAADVRGVQRNDGSVDIGAYEYAAENPGEGTGIQPLQADAWVSVYTQADRVVVENRTDAGLTLTLVGADGRRIAAMPLQRTLSLDRAALPQGLLLLMVQHGDACATHKIVL